MPKTLTMFFSAEFVHLVLMAATILSKLGGGCEERVMKRIFVEFLSLALAVGP